MKHLLLVSNYSNRTGYAWSNIYRLFDFMASELKQDNVVTHISFAKLEPPVEGFTHAHSDFLEYDPHKPGVGESLKLIKYVLKKRIGYIYLTDQPIFRILYLALRLCGARRIICHSRVSVPNPYPAQKETGFKGLAKHIQKRLPGFTVDKMYAVSEFVRNRIIQKSRFPKEKTVVILNGVDLKKFHPPESLNNSTSSTIKIFVCGRATPHKGIDIVIKALSLIRRSGQDSNIEVVYAGDGPYLEEYKQLADRLGVADLINFIGQVPSTEQHLRKSDIACIPSPWGDAFPSSVSEAMASGKPVVTTRAGGIPEIVGSEENAVLVEPGQAEPLADALIALAHDRGKRALLSKRARERAEGALDLGQYYANFISHLRTDLDAQSDCQ
jgi:glycosyltransferase involved in cell wall biosynthesis